MHQEELQGEHMPTTPRSAERVERLPEHARAERFRAESEDLQRRLRERDERIAELIRQVKAEQARAQKNSELYGAEVALRERAEKDLKRSNDARAAAEDEAIAERTLCHEQNGRIQEMEKQLAAAVEAERRTQQALAASQHALGIATNRVESAEAMSVELRAAKQRLEDDKEVLRRDVSRLDPLLAVTEAEIRAERLDSQRAAEHVRQLQAEINVLRQEIGQLTPQLRAAEAEARCEKESSKTLREYIEREYNRMSRENAETKEKLSELMRERDQLLTRNAAVRGSCDILQERCKLAEQRFEKEGSSTASAWREVEVVCAP